jgi:hypothetical protein
VKREAEKDKSHQADQTNTRSGLRSCFSTNELGSAYDGQCGNFFLKKSFESRKIKTPASNNDSLNQAKDGSVSGSRNDIDKEL